MGGSTWAFVRIVEKAALKHLIALCSINFCHYSSSLDTVKATRPRVCSVLGGGLKLAVQTNDLCELPSHEPQAVQIRHVTGLYGWTVQCSYIRNSDLAHEKMTVNDGVETG